MRDKRLSRTSLCGAGQVHHNRSGHFEPGEDIKKVEHTSNMRAEPRGFNCCATLGNNKAGTCSGQQPYSIPMMTAGL